MSRGDWYWPPHGVRVLGLRPSNDRLVGRVEPRIDRAGGRVQMLGLWWEEGFGPRRADGFVDAMRPALRAYLRFAGASRLEWAPHLGGEKRLFLSRPRPSLLREPKPYRILTNCE